AIALLHAEGAAGAGGDAGRVLATVLQEQQPVIQQLVDRAAGHDPEDSAHAFLPCVYVRQRIPGRARTCPGRATGAVNPCAAPAATAAPPRPATPAPAGRPLRARPAPARSRAGARPPPPPARSAPPARRRAPRRASGPP